MPEKKFKIPAPHFYRIGPNGRVPGWYGDTAVKIVESKEGELTPAQKRVVKEEGYVAGPYWDTKKIVTSGVGQTGKWMKKTFKESFEHHEDITRGLTKDYDTLPDYLKSELVQSVYRGDWSGSPTTRKLLAEGSIRKSAKEFLDHEEYLDPRTPQHIKNRIRSVSDALLRYADEIDGVAPGGDSGS